MPDLPAGPTDHAKAFGTQNLDHEAECLLGVSYQEIGRYAVVAPRLLLHLFAPEVERAMQPSCFLGVPRAPFPFRQRRVPRLERERYVDRDDAGADVFDGVERFCLPRRRHSALDDLGPVQFAEQAAASWLPEPFGDTVAAQWIARPQSG